MRSWLPSLLVVSAVVSAGAQSPTPAIGEKPARFGRAALVYDANTQEPVFGAEVTDLVTKNSVKTDTVAGGFVLVPEFVKASGAVLMVRKLGYSPTGPLAVDPLVKDTVLLIPMTRAVTELPAVVSMAVKRPFQVMQEFEDRRNDKSLHGTFIAPEELRAKWDGQEIGSVVNQHAMIALPRGASGKCRVLTYIEGVLSSEPWRKELADAFESIEFYPSPAFAPAQYVGSSSGNVCGIFVVWRRRS